MRARGSLRRRSTWPLVLGAVAVACGTSSDLDVTPAGSGGSGMAPAGAVGGSGAIVVGGFGPTATGGVFGDCRFGAPCAPGTRCSTPGSDCECSASGTYGCLTRDVWGGAPNNTGGTSSGGNGGLGQCQYQPGLEGCTAARAYIQCISDSGGGCGCLSDNPTRCAGCGPADGVTCQNLCSAAEYAVACDLGLPVGCREVLFIPAGVVIYCCPCE